MMKKFQYCIIIGPRTVPCGTPDLTVMWLNKKPSKTTH